ncbi:hypothetical protein C0Q70_04776 [Pomacea canaliculata]|uniref:Uncharacterized protein n=1 Tax=Pomacea canaliculata TaxID=400727 RepID=A0A2T7PJE2_POMCA|nr:hypothetical protein C0Q70_04776 [Pomacea canaliculata]
MIFYNRPWVLCRLLQGRCNDDGGDEVVVVVVMVVEKRRKLLRCNCNGIDKSDSRQSIMGDDFVPVLFNSLWFGACSVGNLSCPAAAPFPQQRRRHPPVLSKYKREDSSFREQVRSGLRSPYA